MNFDDIIVKESPGLCRCCLSEGCYKDLGTEYTWMNDTEIYADMLLDCFDIGITQHNDGPNGPKRLICEVCITRLRDACNFKKQVLDSEKRFIDMLGRGEFRPKVVHYQEDLKAETVEELLEDTYTSEVEYLDDIDYVDDVLVKTEDIINSTSQPSTSEDADNGPKPRKGRPRKQDIKPAKPAKIAKVAKDCKPIPELNSKERTRNLEILFNNTTIIPFKHRGKYICFFCLEDFEDRQRLTEHTLTHLPCSIEEKALRETGKCEVKVDVSIIKCKVCSEQFTNVEDIALHLAEKHQLPYNMSGGAVLVEYRLTDFKCVRCDQSLPDIMSVHGHMNLEHATDVYVCDNCGCSFAKKKVLQKHIRLKHKESYDCSVCSEVFESYSELTKHKESNHVFQCNACFKQFTTPETLSEHIKGHALAGIICRLCHKHFPTETEFLQHAYTCRTAKDSNIKTSVTTHEKVRELRKQIAYVINNSTAVPFKFFRNKFRCFYCPVECDKCDDLRNHTSKMHPVCDTKFKCMELKTRGKGTKIKVDVFSLRCKMCSDERSFDLNALLTHFESTHEASLCDCVDQFMPFQLIQDGFPCPYCDEQFTYFNLLLLHVNDVHSDYSYICVYCGKPFRSDSAWRKHVAVHKNEKTFKCTKCEQKFMVQSQLKVHMGTAHGIKVITCQHCAERFVSQYAKTVHIIKAHGGGHKCSHCDRTFIKYSYMMNHVKKSHLKEKNVECPVCNMRFFDNLRLKMHMVKHTGEKIFVCNYCDKKFLRKRNLKGHINSHLKHSTFTENSGNYQC